MSLFPFSDSCYWVQSDHKRRAIYVKDHHSSPPRSSYCSGGLERWQLNVGCNPNDVPTNNLLCFQSQEIGCRTKMVLYHCGAPIRIRRRRIWSIRTGYANSHWWKHPRNSHSVFCTSSSVFGFIIVFFFRFSSRYERMKRETMGSKFRKEEYSVPKTFSFGN